jgi:hypothetical protein
VATKQTELTNSQVEIEIAQNHGNADLARARLAAEQTVVTSEAEGRRRVLLAEAASREAVVMGEGEARATALRGDAEAGVLRAKASALGDPRLYALTVLARRMASSRQPLVPDRCSSAATARRARRWVRWPRSSTSSATVRPACPTSPRPDRAARRGTCAERARADMRPGPR